ncbi:hypothetical protein OH76DRAFT_634204 [Lentinus brumalis]|uniref:Uncharacterized protein n=1 Tax=Lentinus brumalis TaxID=2498619 RepID=A0A371D8K5_9APHY|nr:hypothetical protein OH76DRAFT_634204 [Polyporus brumalis]
MSLSSSERPTRASAVSVASGEVAEETPFTPKLVVVVIGCLGMFHPLPRRTHAQAPPPMPLQSVSSSSSSASGWCHAGPAVPGTEAAFPSTTTPRQQRVAASPLQTSTGRGAGSVPSADSRHAMTRAWFACPFPLRRLRTRVHCPLPPSPPLAMAARPRCLGFRAAAPVPPAPSSRVRLPPTSLPLPISLLVLVHPLRPSVAVAGEPGSPRTPFIVCLFRGNCDVSGLVLPLTFVCCNVPYVEVLLIFACSLRQMLSC